MKSQSDILKENPDLISFIVSYTDKDCKADWKTFQCYAVDKEHAVEQCINAYPDCNVFNTVPEKITVIKKPSESINVSFKEIPCGGNFR